jgi:hypothetical protein
MVRNANGNTNATSNIVTTVLVLMLKMAIMPYGRSTGYTKKKSNMASIRQRNKNETIVSVIERLLGEHIDQDW